jgi:hypothetical protein
MHGNGNGRGFIRNEAVPIVGQAFTLLEVVPVTVLVCNCEDKKTVSIPGLNTPGQCPACKRVFSVQAVQSVVDQTTGRKTHNVNVVMAIPKESAPAAEQPARVS